MSGFPLNGIKYNSKLIQGLLLAEAPTSVKSVVKGNCSIGFMSYTSSGVIQNTNIGRFCSIAADFTSAPTNHPTDRISSHLFAFSNYGPFKGSLEFEEWIRPVKYIDSGQDVNIGNDVWIGKNVIVKRGIKIGDGAIVGAGSVVTRDVDPYAIVGGVPAKLIRMRFGDEIISRLKRLQWFNYKIDRDSLPTLDVSDIDASLDVLERAIEGKLVDLLAPRKFRITSTDCVEL